MKHIHGTLMIECSRFNSISIHIRLHMYPSDVYILFVRVCVFSVYHEDLYQPLIDSMIACSTADTVTLLGLTREFMKPSFFDRLRQHFTYSLIPHRNIRADDEHSNIGIFACKLRRPSPPPMIEIREKPAVNT